MRGVEELLADIRVGRALQRRVHARWMAEGGEVTAGRTLIPSSTQTEVNLQSQRHAHAASTCSILSGTHQEQDYP